MNAGSLLAAVDAGTGREDRGGCEWGRSASLPSLWSGGGWLDRPLEVEERGIEEVQHNGSGSELELG